MTHKEVNMTSKRKSYKVIFAVITMITVRCFAPLNMTMSFTATPLKKLTTASLPQEYKHV